MAGGVAPSDARGRPTRLPRSRASAGLTSVPSSYYLRSAAPLAAARAGGRMRVGFLAVPALGVAGVLIACRGSERPAATVRLVQAFTPAAPSRTAAPPASPA